RTERGDVDDLAVDHAVLVLLPRLMLQGGEEIGDRPVPAGDHGGDRPELLLDRPDVLRHRERTGHVAEGLERLVGVEWLAPGAQRFEHALADLWTALRELPEPRRLR